MSEESQREAGMKVRREVLGDEHVDRAIAATTDLDRDFQDWITENVWGGLWARGQLSHRDRSLVTIAILAAAGNEELELHLRAAKNTGATPEEISEVLLHVAAYAGVPAANHALKTMKALYEGDTP
ncbi:MAG TPA: 4-carboxymuconolactone decarboxylase [Acidimicrobiia bacterium]|nr:4-carboxymuconolactone decarboxylase [Acidimicrobiia bacterium]